MRSSTSSSSSSSTGGLAAKMKAEFQKRKSEREQETLINPTSKRLRQYDPKYIIRVDTLQNQEIVHEPTSSQGAFSALGRSHKTDKIHHHGYHRYYPRYLEYYRHLSNQYAMLEIGIDQSASLHTWLEYFPNAFVYGIDIGVSKQGERYSIFQCDQSSLIALEQLVFQQISLELHSIFFIIDDGSHIPNHQILSFNYLFQFLLIPGGIYIIEDIETSYWKHGQLYHYPTNYGYQHEYNIIQVFKGLLDEINREFLSEEAKASQQVFLDKYGIDSETTKWISMISFGQNCIIITKKTKEEMEFYDRKYRFDKFV